MLRLVAVVGAGAAAGGPAVRLGRLDLVVASAAAEVPTEAALRAHDALVRTLAGRVDALLPGSFRAVAHDEDDLVRQLAPREADLAAGLDLVRGKEQMTVRVLGAGPPPPATGTEYLRARARVPGLELLRSLAGSLVSAERVRPGRGAPLLGSVYHLIPRGMAGAYAEQVGRGTGELRFRVSGPFAPYAFTGIVP